MIKSKASNEWRRLNEKVGKGKQKLILTEKEDHSFSKHKNSNDKEVRNFFETLHNLPLNPFEAFCKEQSAKGLINVTASK